MKTGNTTWFLTLKNQLNTPQWSPVMKTGNTGLADKMPQWLKGLNGARS